jgi:hypothetical protein
MNIDPITLNTIPNNRKVTIKQYKSSQNYNANSLFEWIHNKATPKNPLTRQPLLNSEINSIYNKVSKETISKLYTNIDIKYIIKNKKLLSVIEKYNIKTKGKRVFLKNSKTKYIIVYPVNFKYLRSLK